MFTHDLDFSALVATAHVHGPSVLQVRTQDPLPSIIGRTVLDVLTVHAEVIARGALVTVNPAGARVRILPV